MIEYENLKPWARSLGYWTFGLGMWAFSIIVLKFGTADALTMIPASYQRIVGLVFVFAPFIGLAKGLSVIPDPIVKTEKREE